jgi:hypothetical protein
MMNDDESACECSAPLDGRGQGDPGRRQKSTRYFFSFFSRGNFKLTLYLLTTNLVSLEEAAN